MWYSYLFVDGTSDLQIQRHDTFEAAVARLEAAVGATTFCKWLDLVLSPEGGISYACWHRPCHKIRRWINAKKHIYLEPGQARPPRQRGWEEQEISVGYSDAEMAAQGYRSALPGLRQVSIFSEAHMRGQIADGVAEGNDRSQDIAALEGGF